MLWKGFNIQGGKKDFIGELISCLQTMFLSYLKRKDPSLRNKNPIINEGIFFFIALFLPNFY